MTKKKLDESVKRQCHAKGVSLINHFDKAKQPLVWAGKNAWRNHLLVTGTIWYREKRLKRNECSEILQCARDANDQT